MVVGVGPRSRFQIAMCCTRQRGRHGSLVAHQITTPTQAQPSRNLEVDVICLILPDVDKVFANIAVTAARKLAWVSQDVGSPFERHSRRTVAAGELHLSRAPSGRHVERINPPSGLK
jgi:hypothetical protein